MRKIIALAMLAMTAFAGHVASQDGTVLPISEPNPPNLKELDVRTATPPKRFEVRVADVGVDEGTPVADYGPTSKFNGKIGKVTIHLKK